jgi:cilia- and flagella-associated protein 251
VYGVVRQEQVLGWTFGASTDVAHNVVNLTDGYSDRVAYVAAHTGIIYDKKTRKQTFLQVARQMVDL